MIDDLCDSGLTLMTVRDKLLAAGAASVKAVVLLDKKARRKVYREGMLHMNTFAILDNTLHTRTKAKWHLSLGLGM